MLLEHISDRRGGRGGEILFCFEVLKRPRHPLSKRRSNKMLLAKPPIPQSSVASPSANHCDTKSQRFGGGKNEGSKRSPSFFRGPPLSTCRHSPNFAPPVLIPKQPFSPPFSSRISIKTRQEEEEEEGPLSPLDGVTDGGRRGIRTQPSLSSTFSLTEGKWRRISPPPPPPLPLPREGERRREGGEIKSLTCHSDAFLQFLPVRISPIQKKLLYSLRL